MRFWSLTGFVLVWLGSHVTAFGTFGKPPALIANFPLKNEARSICPTNRLSSSSTLTSSSVRLNVLNSKSTKDVGMVQGVKDNNYDFQLFGMRNILAAKAWVLFVTFAFALAPGQFGSPTDSAILTNMIADPLHPQLLNALFYTIFNIFAVMPLILASVTLPQSKTTTNGLPAGPFLLASAFVGYFGFGPYLTARAPPETRIMNPSELGWVTRNVFENKFFSVFVLAILLSLPVTLGLISALQTDPVGQWQGLVDLLSTSRLCSVSMVDLFICYITIVALTPQDYMLRKPDVTVDEARKVAVLTALLPYVGSAIYCVVRPPLALEEETN